MVINKSFQESHSEPSRTLQIEHLIRLKTVGSSMQLVNLYKNLKESLKLEEESQVSSRISWVPFGYLQRTLEDSIEIIKDDDLKNLENPGEPQAQNDIYTRHTHVNTY